MHLQLRPCRKRILVYLACGGCKYRPICVKRNPKIEANTVVFELVVCYSACSRTSIYT